MSNLLPILLIVPLAGAFLCLLVPERAAKWVGLVTSFVLLALVLPMAGLAFGNERLGAEPGIYKDGAFGPARQIAWVHDWVMIGGLGAGLRLGCDAISWWLILLTAAIIIFLSMIVEPHPHWPGAGFPTPGQLRLK